MSKVKVWVEDELLISCLERGQFKIIECVAWLRGIWAIIFEDKE